MAVQTQIKGTQPTHHADVSEAATELSDAQDKLASARTFYMRRRDELVAKMQKHGLKQYADRGLKLEVLLENDMRIKLRELKEAKPVRAKKKGRRA